MRPQSFGKQVTSTTLGINWLLTLRLVLITTGRIPARSHSLMAAITSILDSGGISFSTCRLETASGTGVDVVVLEAPGKPAQPVSQRVTNRSAIHAQPDDSQVRASD